MINKGDFGRGEMKNNYCVMCGIKIPKGQRVCSMCYGDIDHGKDGYYRDYMEQWEREHERESDE